MADKLKFIVHRYDPKRAAWWLKCNRCAASFWVDESRIVTGDSIECECGAAQRLCGVGEVRSPIWVPANWRVGDDEPPKSTLRLRSSENYTPRSATKVATLYDAAGESIEALQEAIGVIKDRGCRAMLCVLLTDGRIKFSWLRWLPEAEIEAGGLIEALRSDYSGWLQERTREWEDDE